MDRLVRYHGEGIKFSEHVVELVQRRGAALGLRAPRQLALLALRGARAPPDLPAAARDSRDIFRALFPQSSYAKDLTGDSF